MKKELKQKLYLEVENIFNTYNLHVLIFNNDSIKKEIVELNNKRDLLIEIKQDEISTALESAEATKQSKLEAIKASQEKYKNSLDEYHKKIELLELMNKTYTKIINNGLYIINNELVNLIVNNCKNKRDLNEFINFFEYNREKQKYNFNYSFYYSNTGYFKISYDIPSRSAYNIYSNNIYMGYYVDINNNYVWDLKYYNYNEIKEKYNYKEYEKKINNNFSFEAIKKQCENLLKVYHAETQKQNKFIIESNNKINEANIYNLDGFIRYSI